MQMFNEMMCNFIIIIHEMVTLKWVLIWGLIKLMNAVFRNGVLCFRQPPKSLTYLTLRSAAFCYCGVKDS